MRHAPLVLSATLLLAACGDDAKPAADAVADTLGDTAPDADPDTASDTVDDAAGDTAGVDTAGGDTGADAEVTPAATFTALDLPSPVDVTSNGAFVAIWDGRSEAGDTWLYKVGAKALTLEVAVGSPQRNFPTALSDNLVLTALHGEPVQPGLWDGATWRDLGSLYEAGCGLDPAFPTAGDIGGAWDISAEGAVVVGSLWNGCTTVAFRWSDDGARDFRALEVLGSVPEGGSLAPVNRATVVSDDGLVAAGFAQTALVDRWPAVWSTATTSGALLTTTLFPSDAPGEVLAISADGGVVGGIWNNEAFIATLGESPAVTRLDPLPNVLPGEASRVNALSADGAIAFGQSGGPFLSVPQAFVWTAAGGTRGLREVVVALGVTLDDDVILTNVLGASADGAVIVGTFVDDTFLEKTFVLTLSPGSLR